MPSVNKTPNLKLNYYTADESQIREDVNTDNLNLDMAISSKVDKIENMGLSRNNYTDTDKLKVDNCIQNSGGIVNGVYRIGMNTINVLSKYIIQDTTDTGLKIKTNITRSTPSEYTIIIKGRSHYPMKPMYLMIDIWGRDGGDIYTASYSSFNSYTPTINIGYDSTNTMVLHIDANMQFSTFTIDVISRYSNINVYKNWDIKFEGIGNIVNIKEVQLVN